jgi:hypothetical protein
MNLAETLAVPEMVKTVVAEALLEKLPPVPVQPANEYFAAAVAVNDTAVPEEYPPEQFCAVPTVTVPPAAGLAVVTKG